MPAMRSPADRNTGRGLHVKAVEAALIQNLCPFTELWGMPALQAALHRRLMTTDLVSKWPDNRH